jgi:hypothetical protein
MKILKLVLVAFLIVSAAIVSCSKGSAGPAGETGATGATGAAGAQGPAGANGIDTVYYSAWTTLTTTLDTFTTNGVPDTLYVDTLQTPAITQGVLDSGVILSYVQNYFNNDSSILNTLSYAGFQDVHYLVGEISIDAPFDVTGAKFRYVVIPGNILTQSATFKNYTKQQIKTMDFATATRLLNQAIGKTGLN